MLRLTMPNTRGPEAPDRVATAARRDESRARVFNLVILFVIFCAVFVLSFVSLASADTRVRVGAHEPPGKDAYGRIVFDWAAPTGYKAVIESGRLVVWFDQPFVGRLDLVKRYLGDYVSDAIIEDEGRTVAFPLKAEFGLKTYADGPTVVLDLIRIGSATNAKPTTTTATNAPASPVAPTPATPVNTAKPAASAPAKPATPAATLTVRTGDHTGFGRLVFDWTRSVDYNVDKDGNRLTIRFNQPAKLDYAALNKRLPKAVQLAEPASDDSGTTLVLTLANDARLRHFRSGTGIVVDLLDPITSAKASDSPAAKTAASASSESSDKAPPAKVADGKSGKPATAETKTPAAAAKSPDSAATAPANLLARRPVAPAPAAASEKPAADPAAPSLDELLAGIPALTPKPAPAPKAAAARPTPSSPRSAAAAPAAQPTNAAAAPVAVAGPPRVIVHPLGTVNDLTGLRFAWSQEVGAAIYERSGLLWLIFDRRAGMEVAGAWPRNAIKPETVANETSSNLTVLRWPVPQGAYPGLRRDGKDWLIDLQTSPWRPSADMKPESQAAGSTGGRILVRGQSFGAVREWRDPEVGDHLWVVPSTGYGQGSAAERRLAEVQFLPSLQGLVIKPLSDDVMVRHLAEGVEVAMPGGLNLSRYVAASTNTAVADPKANINADIEPSSARTPIPALATKSGRLFDFDAWRTPNTVNFFDRKRELQMAVIEAPGQGRNAARLALAQFYFAHGYASDALGILQVIAGDDENAMKDPAFRALRGACHLLQHDYTEAGSDLFVSMLDTEREIALWRGALLASQNDWFAASRYFNQAERVLRGYPTDLQMRFGLLAAESALMIDDANLAKFQLDGLARLQPPRVWRDQIDYLLGRALVKLSDRDGANDAWERAMAGVHRLSKTKSRLARAEMLLEDKRVTPTQAIAEIEKLRYAWRGDDTELKVLKRLGELYIEVGDYRNGLGTLREVVSYFPQSQEIPGIQDTMRASFASLYLNGTADKMPMLTALSLYEDFRDLAPGGDAGDTVISKLVDRLVDVELLDRAVDLLKPQVDSRLKGAALADAANRLAIIHLLARQPEQALAVLKRPTPPEATPTAVTQRRQITARTLGELARYKEALALLDNDTSQDADRLRAEIGWRTQNWPLAATAFSKLVPPANQALTDIDRQTVLRLAIAQSLSNNQAGLKGLRQVYGPAMAQSAFKESFDLVTAPGEGPAVDLRAITRQVGEVDQFRAFITSYRDKLLNRKDVPVKPAPAAAAKGQQAASN